MACALEDDRFRARGAYPAMVIRGHFMSRSNILKSVGCLLFVISGLRADDEAPARKGGWFPTLSAKTKKDDSAKTKAKDIEAVEEIDRAIADRSAKRKKLAVQIDREEQDYFRRLEVVDRLMDNAIRNGDQEVIRRLEQLQERIQQVYDKNTASLATPESSKMDLAILREKTASSKTSVTQLLKEEKSASGIQAASRKGAK